MTFAVLEFNDEESQNFNIRIGNHLLFKHCQNWDDFKQIIIEAIDYEYGLDGDEIEELNDPYLNISGFNRRYKEIGIDGKVAEVISEIASKVNKE